MDKKTFSLSIKQEICNQEYSLHEKMVLITPFVMNYFTYVDLDKEDLNLTFSIYTNFIAQKVLEYSQSIFSEAKIELVKKKFHNQIIVNGEINQHIKEIITYVKTKQFLHKKEVNHYLAGVFLTCGSINNLENLNYHLEIQCNNLSFFETVVASLKLCKLFFKTMKRRDKHVIYFKRAEDISDFLKLIHANVADLTFENQRVIRDFNNNIQKANNFDISNIWRTVRTNTEQIEWIKELIVSKKIHEFPKTFQNFCFLRIQNPSVSLSQLSSLYEKKYGKKISRSGMNYYAHKLRKIYFETNQIDNDKNKSSS